MIRLRGETIASKRHRGLWRNGTRVRDGLHEKKHLRRVLFVYSRSGVKTRLYANHFSGFQGAGADINAFRLAVDENADFLHVYAPYALRSVVGMGNIVSFAGTFAGNETFASHRPTPPHVRHTVCRLYSHTYSPIIA